MSVGKELEELIGQASRVKPLNLLPPDASYSQQKLAKIVRDVFDGEIPSSPGFRSACEETFKQLSPLVDFFTRPRSIPEFQELKKDLLEIIWKHKDMLRFPRKEPLTREERQIGKVVEWFYFLLPEIRVFPPVTLDNLVFAEMSPKQVWQEFEVPSNHPLRPTEEKIINTPKAIKLARENQEKNEGRNGLIMGKWRLGAHQSHIDLFEPAKQSLGRDGILFVGVESQRSIWQRRGEEHLVLPDEQRLKRIAALEAVDYAILLDPSENELPNLNDFYYRTWQNLNPDIVFFGSEDYHWRTTYEERARELGTLLLWKHPETSFSNSELLELIKGAG